MTDPNDPEVEKALIKGLTRFHEPDNANPFERVTWNGKKAWRYPISKNIGFECRYCCRVVYYEILDTTRAATDEEGNHIMVESVCPERMT